MDSTNICACFCAVSHPATATMTSCVTPANPGASRVMSHPLLGVSNVPMCLSCNIEHWKLARPLPADVRNNLERVYSMWEAKGWDASPGVFLSLDNGDAALLNISEATWQEFAGQLPIVLSMIAGNWKQWATQLPAGLKVTAVITVWNANALDTGTDEEVHAALAVAADRAIWRHPKRLEIRHACAWTTTGISGSISETKDQPDAPQLEITGGDVLHAMAVLAHTAAVTGAHA